VTTSAAGKTVVGAVGVFQPARRRFLAPASHSVTATVLALCVLAAGAAVVDVYEIDDSGARASLEERLQLNPALGALAPGGRSCGSGGGSSW
jgi:hypothetical protein